MRTASFPRTATLLAGLLALTLVACGNKNDFFHLISSEKIIRKH